MLVTSATEVMIPCILNLLDVCFNDAFDLAKLLLGKACCCCHRDLWR